MLTSRTTRFPLICIVIIITTTFSKVHSQSGLPALYDTIAGLDSSFFHAYNTCDIEKMRSLMSTDIEFYHDQGGLDTSLNTILENTRKNVCGRVTRTLAKGSIEVSPIPGYGAVELGLHSFRNSAEPDAPSHDSRFIVIWHRTNNEWKMSRVISLQ